MRKLQARKQGPRLIVAVHRSTLQGRAYNTHCVVRLHFPRKGSQRSLSSLRVLQTWEWSPDLRSNHLESNQEESPKIVEGPAREDLTRSFYKNPWKEHPRRVFIQATIQGIFKIFMQGPLRQDFTRISMFSGWSNSFFCCLNRAVLILRPSLLQRAIQQQIPTHIYHCWWLKPTCSFLKKPFLLEKNPWLPTSNHVQTLLVGNHAHQI